MIAAPHVRIMGIINVTPDSFSDGGRFIAAKAAIAHAFRLIDEGADIIDIGGESTRPYAEPVGCEEELARVIPVIEAIRARSKVAISIDTTKADVARQALAAGATILNDVSALRHDPAMVDLARQHEGEIIIMHMQGTPGTMQDNPVYGEVVADIIAFFRERITSLERAGIAPNKITIDPGIGFGKTVTHNLSILKHLNRFSELGRPLLLGHSRKRFLGEITGLEVDKRDMVTAVVSALCLEKQVAIFRVHDVAATRHALAVAAALQQAP